MAYELFVRSLTGQGLASRGLLLENIIRRIEAGELADELFSLSECTVGIGIDLDLGTHADFSMKLAG